MTQAFNLSQLANSVDSSGKLGLTTGVTGTLPIANGGTGGNTATAGKVALGIITGANASQVLPKGTVAQRDASPTSGYIRFNTDTNQFEGYNGSSWGNIGGGATGGGSDQVFVENGQVVTTNYTITTGKNAMSAGPITIDTGVTVTVPTDSTWVIV